MAMPHAIACHGMSCHLYNSFCSYYLISFLAEAQVLACYGFTLLLFSGFVLMWNAKCEIVSCSHETETTHWDHPVMGMMMDRLSETNSLRYSAYRTAMKLRMLQKKLCLDLVNLSTVMESCDRHGLRAMNDKLISVPEMTNVLHSIYQVAATEHHNLVNVILCTDLCLNWILNIYDRYAYWLSNF